MLKLFKYEMRKTLTPKLIMLGLFAVLEGFFLYTLLKGKAESCTLITLLTFIASFAGVFFVGIRSIVTLHHDINSKQGYMLFMTPNSNCKILGAKVLECTVSVVLTSLVFFGVCWLDCRLIMDRFPRLSDLKELASMFRQIAQLNIDLDLTSVIVFVINTVVSWLETVVLAFFADILATSLLKGKKFGGLLAFILFILLSVGAGKVTSLIDCGTVTLTTLLKCAVMFAISVIFYAAAAKLMEKKLSV